MKGYICNECRKRTYKIKSLKKDGWDFIYCPTCFNKMKHNK